MCGLTVRTALLRGGDKASWQMLDLIGNFWAPWDGLTAFKIVFSILHLT